MKNLIRQKDFNDRIISTTNVGQMQLKKSTICITSKYFQSTFERVARKIPDNLLFIIGMFSLFFRCI